MSGPSSPSTSIPRVPSMHGIETPRDLYSLWGGFGSGKEGATDKRLEVDFAKDIVLCPIDWRNVFAGMVSGDVSIGFHNDTLSFLSAGAVMIVTRSKAVITAAAEAKLHEALAPITSLVGRAGSSVNWMMFTKKSCTAPWAELDSALAAEYTTLSLTCSGRSFLLGPVDADHFFCFVHDSIDRRVPAVEEDVQLNLHMYNTEQDANVLSVPWFRPLTRYTEFHAKNGYAAVAGCGPNSEKYSLLRSCGPFVSFETDCVDEEEYTHNLRALLTTFKPSRFSLFMLLDPQSLPRLSLQKSGRGGGHPSFVFDGYRVDSKTHNEFAPGYVGSRMNFVRSE